MRSIALLVVLSILGFGCSSADGGGSDANDMVRVERFFTQGFVPDANPETNEDTPTELNQARVLRYFMGDEPAQAPRAILIAMPGFLGGGPSFDGIARSVVRRGTEDGFPVEVWAIDRRSNGMEDLTGMNAAEREGDGEIAWDYYFDGGEADGKTFAGYVPQEDASFMSEWGLQTHIEDLRAVLDLVPAAEQRGHVFLAGHSFGATVVELYAAWRFASDDKRGFDQIAGMIFLDGLMGDTPSAEEDYGPALASIRETERYTTLPLLGIDVYTSAEIVALRTWFDPSGIVDDPVRDQTFEILFGLGPNEMPKATNIATLGLAFDSMHQPLSFSQTTLGTLSGGPTEDFTFPLAGDDVLQRPSDPNATYDWIDAFDSDPQEFTPARNLARSFTIGESNFAEWYFPTRISLDEGAARGGNVDENGWQVAYGIRAFDGELNDAPALCILARNADRCDALRTRLAPTIGPGRPQAGASRDSDLGVTAIEAVGMAHLDLILSDERAAANLVPNAIATFLETHAEGGTVTLPDL
ncbi:MAG: alpha/beta fold hydrolase [Deltaproteobacteria bacterium]|nr:alpha/beta fold hydrolase [Deltaproteobacteria bacterium]